MFLCLSNVMDVCLCVLSDICLYLFLQVARILSPKTGERLIKSAWQWVCHKASQRSSTVGMCRMISSYVTLFLVLIILILPGSSAGHIFSIQLWPCVVKSSKLAAIMGAITIMMLRSSVISYRNYVTIPQYAWPGVAVLTGIALVMLPRNDEATFRYPLFIQMATIGCTMY